MQSAPRIGYGHRNDLEYIANAGLLIGTSVHADMYDVVRYMTN